MQISYIFVKYNNGFINETKFINTIDITKIQPGDKIKNFYNEELSFYNFYHKDSAGFIHFFEKNKFKNFTPDEIQQKIEKEFIHFINLVFSSNATDLLCQSENVNGYSRNSVFQEYMSKLKLNNIHLSPELIDFSISDYINSSNNLLFLSSVISEDNLKLSQFIRANVNVFNTFLAYDNIISDFSSGLFSTSKKEYNESEEVIYFSDALSAIHYTSCVKCVNFLNTQYKKLKI